MGAAISTTKSRDFPTEFLAVCKQSNNILLYKQLSAVFENKV